MGISEVIIRPIADDKTSMAKIENLTLLRVYKGFWTDFNSLNLHQI